MRKMGTCFSFVTVWLKKTRSYDPTDSLPIGSNNSGRIETYCPKSSSSTSVTSSNYCDIQIPSTGNVSAPSSQPENNNLKGIVPQYNGERRPSILKTKSTVDGDKKVAEVTRRRVSFSAILDEQLHYEVDDEEYKMGSVEEDEEDCYYKYASPHSYFSDFSVTAVAWHVHVAIFHELVPSQEREREKCVAQQQKLIFPRHDDVDISSCQCVYFIENYTN